MAHPKSHLPITEFQQERLETLSTRPSTSQKLAWRAKIILLTLKGFSRQAIIDRLGVTYQTVGRWRKRWKEMHGELLLFEQKVEEEPKRKKLMMAKIVDILSDAPRKGTPPKFSQEQIQQIVALACQRPEDVGVPISHWTNTILAREAVRKDIVESISSTRIWEILKKYSPPSP